jgi:uncharacterized protein YbjT (DUF2867 family)
MQNTNTIFLTGATGNQGGAVARNLIEKGFRVRFLTRNPGSARAQNLIGLGAEAVQGDLNESGSYKKKMEGVDGVFSVLPPEFGIDKEKKQGIDLANLAKEYGVRHLVYSSVVGADLHTGIPHWESKFQIENHIKQIGQPFTILRPSSLYENYLIPQVRSRLLKGKLVSPVLKNKVQQFISAHDIGKIVTLIFSNKDKYFGKTITIASEQMDLEQAAKIFSETLGKKIEYQHLPMFITRLAMGKSLYKMFKWVNENDAVFIKDLKGFKNEYPNLIGLKEWIKLYFK